MISTGVPPTAGEAAERWVEPRCSPFTSFVLSLLSPGSFTRKRAAKGPTKTSRCTVMFQEPRISARVVCGLLDPTEKAASPDPSFSSSVSGDVCFSV